MGVKDTKAKEFLSDNERFADLFNFYLYDGKQVIKATDLREQDTTQVLSVFGADKKEILKQRWRDILKSVIIKTSEYGIFVLLGVENQSAVHYAMPVKNLLYDAMEYSSQISEAARLHRRNKDYADTAEFLSGFRREDKLTPVITLMVYWGTDEWDAPRCLHEMIDDKYHQLLQYVDNYHLHLIIPEEIDEFGRFQTSLGAVLEFIKASKSEEMMDKVVHDNPMFKQLNSEAVSAINVFTGIRIPVEEKEGKIDMCKAWNDHKMSGVMEGKREGKDIINQLNICLIKDGRQDDLLKAASDPVYQQELIMYYGLEPDEEEVEV